MKLIIEQKEFKLNYEYKIFDDKGLIYRGKANRTILPQPRKITVDDLNNNEVCILKEENIIKFIMSFIPVLGWFKFSSCPYNLYINGVKQGFLDKVMWRKSKGPSIVGEIKGSKISIYEHSGNQYSIFKDNVQQGSIKKEHWKQGDGDRYIVLYSREFGGEMISLIGILVDVIWSTTDTSIKTYSYEYTWVIGGRKKDEDWLPED